ncbi:MAG: ATP-binding cassette domain-containing protein [Candidatus Brocadiia bacterium]
MSFLTASDLCVSVGGFAMRDVSFELSRGEYLSVIGPSGVGKSVLLGAIAGFHRLERGSLVVGGQEVSSAAPEARDVGIVYQDYALFPHLTVGDNIAYGLRHRLRERAARRTRVEEMADALGLRGMLRKKPQALSGGEKQRTALARALVIRPRLLLMDEPFSSLDPPATRALRKLVGRLVRRFGITVLHVAHDLEDVWALADSVLLLQDGTVGACGPVNDVTQPPAVPFLRRVEGLRLVRGTVVERREGVSFVQAAGLRLATSDRADVGQKVRLVLRPQDVTLYTERPAGASARNVLRGRVTRVHSMGEAALIGLRSGELEFNAFLTANAVQSLSLAAGDAVFATIKAVHLSMP